MLICTVAAKHRQSSRGRVIGLCIQALYAIAPTQSTAADLRILPEPQQISAHVYAWIGPYGGPNIDNKGFRMNLAFVVGKQYVAVIDSGFYPAMAKAMIQRIGAITDLPIRYVINSNSQPERFFGNDAFKQRGASIIAHKIEIQRMRENASQYAQFIETSMQFKPDSIQIPADPDRAISQAIRLDLGGKVILDVLSYKAAHTPAPLIVHIPIDNIVYAGDILYSGRLLAITAGGSIAQWLDTFNDLKKFNGALFIPGHGQPDQLEAFQKPTYEYLQLLNTHMTKMLSQGVEMQDAIDKLDQSKFSYLANYKDLAGRNANRAYQEAEWAAFN